MGRMNEMGSLVIFVEHFDFEVFLAQRRQTLALPFDVFNMPLGLEVLSLFMRGSEDGSFPAGGAFKYFFFSLCLIVIILDLILIHLNFFLFFLFFLSFLFLVFQ